MTIIKKHKKGVWLISIFMFLLVGFILVTATVSVAGEDNEEGLKQCREIEILPNTINVEGSTVTIHSQYDSDNFNAANYTVTLNGIAQSSISVSNGDLIINLNPNDMVSTTNELILTYVGDTACTKTYRFAVESLVSNPYYNSQSCINYRNTYQNDANMAAAVSICFEEQVTQARLDAFSIDRINQYIETAVNLHNLSNVSDPVVIPTDAKEISDPTNPDLTGAQCDTFSERDSTRKYYHTGTSSIDVTNDGINDCEVECVETVEVIWDPPVETQIGMCFEYVAEIRTTMDCSGKYTGNIPSAPEVCTLVPQCTTKTGTNYQTGGPDEDFDNCITECDGGEYTQACINKCYTKVYENEETDELSINSNNATILTYQTKNSNDDLNTIRKVDASDTESENRNFWLSEYGARYRDGEDLMTLARELYQRYSQMIADNGLSYFGSYAKDSQGRTYWNTNSGQNYISVAPWYLSSVEQTAETIKLWLGYDNLASSSATFAYREQNGFLMQTTRNGVDADCTDSCQLIGQCPANSVPTQEAANLISQSQQQETQNVAAKCDATASLCSNNQTEGTASFDITVDNPIESDEDYEVIYDATQNKGGTDVVGDDIVIDTNGICYEEEYPPYTYRDVLTFPKHYLNNKTHIITDKEPEDTSIYTELGRKFCTRMDSTPINVNWYRWKRYYDHSKENYGLTSEEMSIINQEVNENQNIHVNIENFGYYNWNIPLTCFYALALPDDDDKVECDPKVEICDNDNPICDPSVEECDYECDPDEEDCEWDITDAYGFRSISLTNLFPASEEGSSTRDPYFNWSCGATNLSNQDYLVQPVALRENIQKAGNSIYDEANEEKYLDYEFTLTPTTINAIRNYNSEQGSYLNPTDDKSQSSAGINKTPGISVYKSSFIDEMSERYGTDFLVKRGLIGCNNQSSATQCDTAIYQDSQLCYDTYQSESASRRGGE